jgi:arylsulfatase A
MNVDHSRFSRRRIRMNLGWQEQGRAMNENTGGDAFSGVGRAVRRSAASGGITAAVLLALIHLPASALSQAASEADRPPNIVFILADDLGYGDLGVYGQRTIQTPRLDQMAREGIRFTDHYSGSPVCAPARSVLMTGQHTGHTTVRGNHGVDSRGEQVRVPLRAEDVTVAEVLKDAGYVTGMIGKWGLGEPGSTGVPEAQGFDYFFGFLNQQHAHTYYPEYVWRNQERVVFAGNRDGAREEHVHELLTKEAIAFVERYRERPFFLYLPYTIPHAELAPPPGSLARYVDGNGNSIFPETPFTGAATYAAQPMPNAAYAAMVTRLDRDVGRILDRLRELGLAENTLVIFTSDNGPAREGGADPAFFSSSGSLRGIKRDLYEGGIRVPMIAWWPRRIAAGSVTDHPSAFWDFLPTAAELAGARPPAGIDGISYVPALLGHAQLEHEYLYWEFLLGGDARQALRMGKWKAVRYGEQHPIELYDLDTDPGETRDVAGAHPQRVRRAAELFREARTPSPWFPFPAERARAGVAAEAVSSRRGESWKALLREAGEVKCSDSIRISSRSQGEENTPPW